MEPLDPFPSRCRRDAGTTGALSPAKLSVGLKTYTEPKKGPFDSKRTIVYIELLFAFPVSLPGCRVLDFGALRPTSIRMTLIQAWSIEAFERPSGLNLVVHIPLCDYRRIWYTASTSWFIWPPLNGSFGLN